MTGPIDPDATRPLPGDGGGGGDATLPAGTPVGSTSDGPVVVGAPPPEPPSDSYSDDGDDDEPRRNWWWLAALAGGLAIGVIIALVASGGDDKPETTTTSSSSSTSTSTSTSTVATLPPTAPPTVPQPPGQVTNLTAAPGGGSGEVSLSWDAVPGAAQYRIYRSGTQGISGSLIATSNSDSYVDTPGMHSYYEVSAVSSGGLEGERSVEVCGAVTGDPC
jgi:hypothetical protein